MQLIIDIPEEQYNDIVKHLTDNDGNYAYSDFNLREIIRNGTPYNPTGDCISREALKDAIENQDKFACLPDTTLVPFRMLNEPEKNYEPYVHLRDIRNAIDNAPAVEPRDNFDLGYVQGLEDMKSDIITLIANEYTSHGELIPNWLTIGETKVSDRQKKGGTE